MISALEKLKSLISTTGKTGKSQSTEVLPVLPVDDSSASEIKNSFAGFAGHENEPFYSEEAGEVSPVQSCTACIYRSRLRPADCVGYCFNGDVRDSLEHAYGPNHPLRICPKNQGADCLHFESSA